MHDQDRLVEMVMGSVVCGVETSLFWGQSHAVCRRRAMVADDPVQAFVLEVDLKVEGRASKTVVSVYYSLPARCVKWLYGRKKPRT